MPKFVVVKPIAVQVPQEDGGEDVTKHYPRPGVEVELSDAQAAPLLEHGRITPVEVELEAALPPGDGTEKSAESTGEQNSAIEGTTGPAQDGAAEKPAAKSRRSS